MNYRVVMGRRGWLTVEQRRIVHGQRERRKEVRLGWNFQLGSRRETVFLCTTRVLCKANAMQIHVKVDNLCRRLPLLFVMV